jgi:acyl-CoA synthetase (AMP-forming)/AMP-acid ligase II
MEWSLPAVHDVVTSAVPEREMLVWKDTRRTFREVANRSRAFAAYLAGLGIGLRHERDELERWECGQSPVAILLHNCPEYIEAMLGASRARAVPFNVNQHYQASEIRSLLDMLGTEAVVYHRALGPLLPAALDGRTPALIDVDDGSATARLPGAMSFEDIVRSAAPTDALPMASRDDLYIVCTGGTTGSPKAVLWRQADIFVSAMGGTDDATAESLATAALVGSGTWFAAPPLMHAAAQWTAFAAIHTGGTVVDRKSVV